MSYLIDKFKMKGRVMEVCDRFARNAIAGLARVAQTGSYNDLIDKPTIPTGQVNSDWNAVSGVAEILNKPNLATVATSGSYDDLLNKPTIPAEQVNSDWNAVSGKAEILNKPNLATVATSGSYNDLSNKPTIPSAQVNSDWNASSGVAEILNKPSLATVATSGSYDDLSNKPTIPTVNDAKLTIQRNGTKVKDFTANASSNVTCNIQCEPPITWVTSGKWKYWQDNAGYYHLHYYNTHTIDFNTAYGSNCYIPSSALSINLPVTLTGGLGISASAMINGYVVDISINSLESSKIKIWPHIFNANGSKSVGISISLIGY